VSHLLQLAVEMLIVFYPQVGQTLQHSISIVNKNLIKKILLTSLRASRLTSFIVSVTFVKILSDPNMGIGI